MYSIAPDYEELAQRTSDGIDVSLLWSRETNAVAVFVADGRSGEEFTVHVPSGHAMDAFHHPYAYIGSYAVAA